MDNLDLLKEKLLSVVENSSREELEQLVVNLGLGSKTSYEYVMCFAGEVDQEVIGYIKDDVTTVIDFYSDNNFIDKDDLESFTFDLANIIDSYLPLLIERNYGEYAEDLNKFIQSKIKKLNGINKDELLDLCRKYDLNNAA